MHTKGNIQTQIQQKRNDSVGREHTKYNPQIHRRQHTQNY